MGYHSGVRTKLHDLPETPTSRSTAKTTGRHEDRVRMLLGSPPAGPATNIQSLIPAMQACPGLAYPLTRAGRPCDRNQCQRCRSHHDKSEPCSQAVPPTPNVRAESEQLVYGLCAVAASQRSLSSAPATQAARASSTQRRPKWHWRQHRKPGPDTSAFIATHYGATALMPLSRVMPAIHGAR